MPNQQNRKKKQQSSYQPGSGSRYHEENAGNVTGYGEIDPNVEALTNKTDNSSSSS